ncbi:MAG: tetratricopeptide repeat protein [Bacteroidota bacterium]|nr:tetratricopeptide repeat protein [Bacteroidota bacterium]
MANKPITKNKGTVNHRNIKQQHPLKKKVSLTEKEKQNILYAIIGIFFLTLIAFWPSFKNDFVGWDDEGYLHENLAFIGKIDIKKIFSNFVMANYHPLTIFLYAIEYHFVKLNPFLYHFTNVVLHLCNTLLVFWLGFKMSRKLGVAVIFSLLFAVHPLHVESVSWISETKDVLYGFFFIFSMIFYLYYIDDKKKNKYYLISFIFFVFSVLSKAMAVSLPLVLLLIDYLKEKQITKRMVIEKIPFFIISIIFGILAIIAQKHAEGLYNVSAYSSLDKLLFPFYAIMFYVYKMFVPANLAIIYPYPAKVGGVLPGIYYFAPIAFISLALITYFSLRKTKLLLYAVLFYLACIILVIQVLPVGMSLASDRYFYISCLGFFYAGGEGFTYLYNKKLSGKISLKYIITGIAALIILSYSIATFQRAKVWTNSLTLWTDMIPKEPQIDKVYYGIGTYWYRIGDKQGVDDKARKEAKEKAKYFYKKTLECNQSNEKALNNLGNCYYNEAKYDSAFIYYSKLVQVNPKYTLGLHNLGNYYYAKLNMQKAIEYYNRVIDIDPNFSLTYYTLGLCYQALRDDNKANEYFIKGARLGEANSQKILQSKNISY